MLNQTVYSCQIEGAHIGECWYIHCNLEQGIDTRSDFIEVYFTMCDKNH